MTDENDALERKAPASIPNSPNTLCQAKANNSHQSFSLEGIISVVQRTFIAFILPRQPAELLFHSLTLMSTSFMNDAYIYFHYSLISIQATELVFCDANAYSAYDRARGRNESLFDGWKDVPTSGQRKPAQPRDALSFYAISATARPTGTSSLPSSTIPLTFCQNGIELSTHNDTSDK